MNAENSTENSMIEAYDELNRKVYIPYAEYMNKVLPHNLMLHWDKPDELAATIINAFHDGFYTDDIKQALKRLIEIDTIVERSASLYGTFLLQTQCYLEAEEFFLHHLALHPRHPYILTNLAKAQEFLDKPMNALITLEESLMADSNQENAFASWCALKREAAKAQGLTPDVATLTTFEEADALFGGWRSKVALGSYYAQMHNKDMALQYYKSLLNAEWEPEALNHISGDLGQNGFFQEAITLVAPLFDPYKHDIITGFNLLQAYLQSENQLEGQKLLKELYNLERPDYSEQLSKFKMELAKLNHTPNEIYLTDFLINFPLWCYGWNIKHGLDSLQTGKKIAILQFSCNTKSSTNNISFDVENTEGRLARAIPLFLLENIYYGTDASGCVILPINKKDNSYVLHGEPPLNENTQIAQLLKQGYDAVVTGILTENQIKITYWHTAEESAQQTFAFNSYTPGKAIAQIEQFIFEKMDIFFDPMFKKNKRGFQYVSEEHISEYLLLISQHLTLYKSTQNNEAIDAHHLLRGLIKLAKETHNTQIQLNIISVIHLCINHNLPAIKIHVTTIITWLKNVIERGNTLQTIAEKTAEALNRYCKT